MTETGEYYFVLRADGQVHASDIRHVAAAPGVIITASRDQTAGLHYFPPINNNNNNINNNNNNNNNNNSQDSLGTAPALALIGHGAFVNFALYHPNFNLLNNESCIITGGNDNHIAVWNINTAALEAVLDGHAHGVCCGVVISNNNNNNNNGDIVTGDWGGVCIVFDNITGKVKQSYTGHKTAVRGIAQLPETNYIISASGDKTIHQWNIETGETITIFTGHKDVVQCICAISSTQFASGGNDANIFIWDTSLLTEPVQILSLHQSLVYGLCYCPQRQLLFSASEDRTVKVWKNNNNNNNNNSTLEFHIIQSINHPCVVWSICIIDIGDIATAGADGVLRVWTTNENNMATIEKLQQLESKIANQKIDIKVVAVPGLDMSNLPNVNELHLRRGTFEGERVLARAENNNNNNNNNNIIEVYTWNLGRWDKVGIVVSGTEGNNYTGGPQAKPKKYLNGEAYDYIFDVDVDGKMLKLTYNRGQSVYDAAQRFIDDHRNIVSQSQKEEIQNFILNNIDPEDVQLLVGGATHNINNNNINNSNIGEPVYSEFAREAAALRQAGGNTIPSWSEALQNMETAGVASNEIAFSGYAREGITLQQQNNNNINNNSNNNNNDAIVVWDSYKLFTTFNATGAKNKINELTGNIQSGELVQKVLDIATRGESPNKSIIDDIISLYNQLPQLKRFPAIDLLSHLLVIVSSPFDWVMLLLNDDENNNNNNNSRNFIEELVKNLRDASDAEALVITRLFAHIIAALQKPNSEVKLSQNQISFLLLIITKSPQPLLRTNNNNLKIAISALIRNASVLFSQNETLLISLFGIDKIEECVQGVIRLISQWLVFEPISSPHARELVATILTLLFSGNNNFNNNNNNNNNINNNNIAAAAITVGRSTLSHTLRAMKTSSDVYLQKAARDILKLFDDTESN